MIFFSPLFILLLPCLGQIRPLPPDLKHRKMGKGVDGWEKEWKSQVIGKRYSSYFWVGKIYTFFGIVDRWLTRAWSKYPWPDQGFKSCGTGLSQFFVEPGCIGAPFYPDTREGMSQDVPISTLGCWRDVLSQYTGQYPIPVSHRTSRRDLKSWTRPPGGLVQFTKFRTLWMTSDTP